MRRVLHALAVLVATALVVPIAAAGTVMAALLFLPLPANMPEPLAGVTSQISRVFDVHGQQIGEFRQFEVSKEVDPADIEANPYLRNAVVAAEDRRFYQHPGVDVIGTIRALWADVRGGGFVQGGSTITQQYVKNAYVGNDRSLSRKIREAILASQLDRQVEKDEILFRYLSTTYFGEGAHGVGAAAETYFGKTNVRDLTLSEAATLVGLIPAPSRYEPRGNIELAEQKRRIVLEAMHDEGYIDDVEYLEAVKQELWLGAFGPPPPADHGWTVVQPRPQVRTAHPYFIDYVRRYVEAKYGAGSVYTGGFQIYTTMDPKMQAAAEEEVARALEGIPPHEKGGPIEMALASIEPGSGYVKALVGGRDFYTEGGQNNLAITAPGRFGRQPGSAFKPFVLAEALEQGVELSTTYSGRSPMDINGTPFHNYGGTGYGTLTLAEATKRSVNTIYVQLLRDVGIEPTMELARAHGVQGSVFTPELGLAVALGTIGTSPLDMASAYGVWAARGERAPPTPVVKILDSDGVVLEDNTPEHLERTRVVKEVTADTMNEVLQGVFTPGGTARGKGLEGRRAAGKTGTTQDNRDAWFVGYTPNLSTAVWIGYRDREVPMEGIGGVRGGVTGGTIPASVWQRYMARAHDGLEVVEFTEPAPIEDIADDAKREARGGFDVGDRRSPRGTPDGVTESEPLPPPTVEPPPSTTSTTPGGGILDPDDRDDDDL